MISTEDHLFNLYISLLGGDGRPLGAVIEHVWLECGLFEIRVVVSQGLRLYRQEAFKNPIQTSTSIFRHPVPTVRH